MLYYRHHITNALAALRHHCHSTGCHCLSAIVSDSLVWVLPGAVCLDDDASARDDDAEVADKDVEEVLCEVWSVSICVTPPCDVPFTSDCKSDRAWRRAESVLMIQSRDGGGASAMCGWGRNVLRQCRACS